MSDRPTLLDARNPRDLSVGERVAVWTFRRPFHSSPACVEVPQKALIPAQDLAAVATSFRVAHEEMVRHQGVGLRLAERCSMLLTRHERRLLRATTVAQDFDEALIDNYLFPLAPNRCARPYLAHAVTMLAESLGTAGHWLPRHRLDCSLPAPALTVARLHGADLRSAAVAWPDIPKSSDAMAVVR